MPRIAFSRRRTLPGGNIVKMIGVLLPGLLLVGLCAMQPASAQDVPPGTYLRSCGHAYLQGGTLIAACLRTDGSARPTAVPAVQDCDGDICNMNDAPTWNFPGALTLPPPYASGKPSPPDGRLETGHPRALTTRPPP